MLEIYMCYSTANYCVGGWALKRTCSRYTCVIVLLIIVWAGGWALIGKRTCSRYTCVIVLLIIVWAGGL